MESFTGFGQSLTSQSINATNYFTYRKWGLGADEALPFRYILFWYLNQPGVEHLIRNLTDRHASVLRHCCHKGALDFGVDGGRKYQSFLSTCYESVHFRLKIW